jgi:hypothetical protein
MKRRCPTCHFDWINLPLISIGGVPGDYYLDCPITDHEEVEYRVEYLTSFNGLHIMWVSVNGVQAPVAFPVSSSTLSLIPPGVAYGSFMIVPSNASIFPMQEWEKVTNAQNRVFVKIEAINNLPCMVGIRFRVHNHVAGRPHMVHVVTDTDFEDTIHEAREQAEMNRLGYVKHPERVPL